MFANKHRKKALLAIRRLRRRTRIRIRIRSSIREMMKMKTRSEFNITIDCKLQF